MTPQEQQQTREAWDKLAIGFDEFTTPFAIRLGEDALHRVGLPVRACGSWTWQPVAGP